MVCNPAYRIQPRGQAPGHSPIPPVNRRVLYEIPHPLEITSFTGTQRVERLCTRNTRMKLETIHRVGFRSSIRAKSVSNAEDQHPLGVFHSRGSVPTRRRRSVPECSLVSDGKTDQQSWLETKPHGSPNQTRVCRCTTCGGYRYLCCVRCRGVVAGFT
jgi:hypothetical protein